METDKRHEKAAAPEERGTKTDFVDSSKKGSDLNAQLSPAEFAVPTEIQHIKRKRSRPGEVNRDATKIEQSKIVQPQIDDTGTEAEHTQRSQNKKADEMKKVSSWN